MTPPLLAKRPVRDNSYPMCSRFENRASPEDLRRRFGLREFPQFPPAAELRPTDAALVIAAARTPRVLRWGLPAPWDGKPLINARAETLAEKATFRPLLESRCLVPATAYFEWRKADGAKLKNRIAPADPAAVPFAFAGLMDGEHFTLVTCAPAPSVAHVHTRMPVILAAGAEDAWIDPGTPFAQAGAALVPYGEGPLAAVEDLPPPPRQGSLFG
ncbi:MAG: SOS response-associated peptidase [Hyphomicrobiales bacterium]|nr:SOS response-associated peptidase [Hyphomicrobiales bacterium]MCP5370861.1 SOS response-associated peptidase [Hyphomicrobiales bacterium]